jgi:hypothetical protein
MNNYSTYLSKSRNEITKLKAKADKIESELALETDFDIYIEKDRKLNNLLLKIETEENYIFPDKKKKPLKISIQKIVTRQSKRCG